MDKQEMKTKKTRMKVRDEYVPAGIPDALDFPKFYKNGTKFTRIDSKNQFTQVQLMQTNIVIRYGHNIHMVQETQEQDIASDKSTFDNALKTALQRLQQ